MSNRVRCKMYCHGVTPHQYQEGMSMVQLGAVWSKATGTDDDENALFGKLTPFGSFNSAMTSEAAKLFEAGKTYYVDFTAAD
ncbi:hypothetical protein [Pseudomonas pseudonitroreducens]|uniref:hypothetical protein n=1 Tax=Pseudomonas pseudonitroreducens TaxID=2892326 RepID=UPI001F42CB5B|nr:hypothetical protein [Pseudomonas pseudonitroreducens]